MSLLSKIKKGAQVLPNFLVNPKPEDIFFMVFAITYLCNSKCIMCNIWQKYKKCPEKYNEELSIEEIRDLLGQSQLLRQLRLLLIAGGEPFLKKDLTDIIIFFYELNHSLSIIIPTNGQNPDLIEDKLKVIRHNLVKKGIREYSLVVGISLDGMEETHERMRGLKGGFQRALDTVERIRRIGGLKAGFQFTFTPANYRDFSSVYDLSKRLDVHLGFQFAQASNHYYDNKQQMFKWTDEQLAEVRDILIRTGYFDILRTEFVVNGQYNRSLANRLLNYNFYFLEYVIDYQRNPKRSFHCFSGTHSCFLDPYGYVYPCIMLGKSFGNIRKVKFDSLWKSSTAEQIRHSISRRECHCCSFCDIPVSLPRNWRIIPWNLKNMILPSAKSESGVAR